jgi:hypothetical protein
MATSRTQPSAPFASRELNGEVLLEELAELRSAQVQQRHLEDCVLHLRGLAGVRVSEATARLKQLASNRFAGQPALASLLVRWAWRLKGEVDVPLLVGHLERLALTSALITALRRGAERLPRGGRG